MTKLRATVSLPVLALIGFGLAFVPQTVDAHATAEEGAVNPAQEQLGNGPRWMLSQNRDFPKPTSPSEDPNAELNKAKGGMGKGSMSDSKSKFPTATSGGGEPNAELNKATGGMAKEKMTEPKSEFPSATSGGGEPNLELPAKK